MYSVSYVPHQGWYLYKDGKIVSVRSHETEWDAIDELAEIDPFAANELRSIHEGVS